MMAIARVNIPTPTAPVGVSDYQAQLDQITALNQAFTGRNPVDGSTIRAGTVMMVGSVLYKSTTDTAITGTPSLYVKIIPSGATASASFVASLSGVTWNHAYGGYYDGSGNLYLFDEGIAVASGVVTSPMTDIGRSAGPRKRTFTSSGTFVVPTGVTEVWVTGCAAGGNGGAGGAANGGSGGARGQSVIKKSINVTPGSSITVTIGAVGNNTTFGGLLTLAFGSNGSSGGGYNGGGGAGGVSGSGSSGVVSGGVGGSGNGTGGGGGGGGADSPLIGVAGSAGVAGGGGGGGGGGAGGVNGGGGGGGSGSGAASGAGGAGNAYGSGGGGGGGGGTSGGAGGAGGPGILIVEW